MKNIIQFALSILFTSPGENASMDDVSIFISSSISGMYNFPWLSIVPLVSNLLLINLSNKIVGKRLLSFLVLSR